MLQFATILSVIAVIALTQGGFLASLWWMDRGSAAVAWWAAAFAVLAAGCGLTVWQVFNGPAVAGVAGAALIVSSFGLIWQAVRLFDGRAVIWPALAGAPVIWFAIVMAVGAAVDVNMVITSAGLLCCGYVLLALYEVWRGRREALPSRQPLAAALLVVLVCLLVQIMLGAGPGPAGVATRAMPYGVWLTLAAAIAISTAAALALGMSRERRQRSHEVVTALDPRTGALSLGAFLAPAARLVAAQLRLGAPMTFVSIQLDGQPPASVEARLCAIHDQLMELTRPSDIIARGKAGAIAVVMPGVEPDIVAVKMRRVLERSAAVVAEPGDAGVWSRKTAVDDTDVTWEAPVRARVGMVSSSEVGHDLRAMMLAAEAAVDDARSADGAHFSDTLVTYSARRPAVSRSASSWPGGVILSRLGDARHAGAFND